VVPGLNKVFRFIQSQKPHSRVPWQVTEVRHDPHANAHRIQTVVPKTGAGAGKYEHPRACTGSRRARE